MRHAYFFQGPMAASRPGRDRGTLPFSRTFHPEHVAFCHEASHLFAPRSSTAFGALLNTFLFNQKRLFRMNMSVIVIFELMLLLTKRVSYHQDAYYAFSLLQSVSAVNKIIVQLPLNVIVVFSASQVDHEEPFGPKGKTPWITLNGEDFTDSHLIIEMLSDQYNIDLTNSLTAEQRAAAKAFTVMIDEHVCW